MESFFLMHQLMQILFLLVFLGAIGSVLVTIFRDLNQWNKNNHSPRLTVEAEVVEKRMQVRRRNTGNQGHMNYRTYTDYYATFQFESGDRLELKLADSEAGLIVEGDKGKLTFQGTRFISFQRSI